MKRVFGYVLFGFGVFAIILAILLPTFVVPAATKTPNNLNISIVSTGPATVLDPTTGTASDVQLQATRKVRTDGNASDSSVTVVDESVCIVIASGSGTPSCVKDASQGLLNVSTDRVAADRKTGLAVNDAKYKETVDDEATPHSGLSYKWPFSAKKQTYQFYQPDVKKAFPATYSGTEKINGLTTYKYVCPTGDQDYLISGLAAGTYNDTRTVWIEPKTGVIVKGSEKQTQTLADGTVALDTTLTFDDPSVRYQVNFAKNSISKLTAVGLWAPLVLGILGVVALLTGVVLYRREWSASRESTSTQPSNAPGAHSL